MKQLIALLLLSCLCIVSCSSSKGPVEPSTSSQNSTVSTTNSSNQSATKTPSQTITPSPTAIPPPSPTATPISPSAQKVSDGKISNIKIVPFDSSTGELGEEIKTNEDYSNSLAMSAFVVVEVSSQAYFEGISESETYKYIKVEITVMNNKRQIAKKIEQIWLSDLSNDRKFFVPVWVDPLMCGDVKINARIIGQKTVSTMKLNLASDCQCTL